MVEQLAVVLEKARKSLPMPPWIVAGTLSSLKAMNASLPLPKSPTMLVTPLKRSS